MIRHNKKGLLWRNGIKMDDSVFLSGSECKKMFFGKEIYIFGTGVDGEAAHKELSQYADVLAYIDNNRYGEGRKFFDKDIICVEEFLNRRNDEQKIVVASYRYAMEICEQLMNVSLLPEKDFFVWDDKYLFHYDVNTSEYISFLRSIWNCHKKNNYENRILVPFDNRHDLVPVIYAYCANYFAEKYDATIYAYFRGGSNQNNASRVIREIYNAFNVQDLINTELSDSQQIESDQICDTIWKTLSSWEDWKNITVYGICFGTTIIRELLRTYIPSFNLKDEKMYLFLKKAIRTIVFWHHYIFENDIRIVLLADGVTWDGYIRDIAITKGIPTYALCYKMARMTLDFIDGQAYQYFKQMWEQLTPKEQTFGLKWAKKHLEERLQGGTGEIPVWDREKFAFAEKKNKVKILEENDKIKIMICPHIFEEDSFFCGEQIFDNNYFAWLCHLGELSEKMPQYDWYLKMHPSSSRRDFIIIDMIMDKYHQIKRIPENVSPLQLKDEGVTYALTVYGSIGHEYPEIGIQVINAGLNPHSTFDFTWNPKTKEEYDNLIMNLGKLEPKKNKEELYQFYSLNYLYYDWEFTSWRSLFFENPLLSLDRLALEAQQLSLGTWLYDEYMKEWTIERHEKIWSQLGIVFQKLDEWKPDILYKKNVNIEEMS